MPDPRPSDVYLFPSEPDTSDIKLRPGEAAAAAGGLLGVTRMRRSLGRVTVMRR